MVQKQPSYLKTLLKEYGEPEHLCHKSLSTFLIYLLLINNLMSSLSLEKWNIPEQVYLQKMAASYLIWKYLCLSGPLLILRASILWRKHLEHPSYCTFISALFHFVHVLFILFSLVSFSDFGMDGMMEGGALLFVSFNPTKTGRNNFETQISLYFSSVSSQFPVKNIWQQAHWTASGTGGELV